MIKGLGSVEFTTANGLTIDRFLSDYWSTEIDNAANSTSVDVDIIMINK